MNTPKFPQTYAALEAYDLYFNAIADLPVDEIDVERFISRLSELGDAIREAFKAETPGLRAEDANNWNVDEWTGDGKDLRRIVGMSAPREGMERESVVGGGAVPRDTFLEVS
jgi:hypothetical protein